MAELPPASTEIDPTFSDSTQQSYKPRPLGPDTFTGLVDNSPAAVEARYRYNPISSQGPTNLSGGKLYKARLDADLELSKDPNRGYNAWNRKRQEAIDRGEDPNSEMLDRIEDRVPDSYLERAYRKVMGKGKTKKEERERREEKERRKTEKLERDGVGLGTADVCGQIGRGNEDDGAIR